MECDIYWSKVAFSEKRNQKCSLKVIRVTFLEVSYIRKRFLWLCWNPHHRAMQSECNFCAFPFCVAHSICSLIFPSSVAGYLSVLSSCRPIHQGRLGSLHRSITLALVSNGDGHRWPTTANEEVRGSRITLLVQGSGRDMVGLSSVHRSALSCLWLGLIWFLSPLLGDCTSCLLHCQEKCFEEKHQWRTT